MSLAKSMTSHSRPDDEVVNPAHPGNGYIIVMDKVYEVYTELDLIGGSYYTHRDMVADVTGFRYVNNGVSTKCLVIDISTKSIRFVASPMTVSGVITDGKLVTKIGLGACPYGNDYLFRVSKKGSREIMELLEELTYDNARMIHSKLSDLYKHYCLVMYRLNRFWPSKPTKK